MENKQKVFKASKYQQALFDLITDEDGNALVAAVAGSGKTTSLIKAIELVRGDKTVHFFAFNSSIAKEIKAKLPSSQMISASTIHSYGLKAILKHTGARFDDMVDDNKYGKLFDELYVIPSNPVDSVAEIKTRVMPIISLCRVNMIETAEDALTMSDKYDLVVSLEDCMLIMDILKVGKNRIDTIDFTDMIWLPVVLGLKTEKYDFIFIDECQDLSELQRTLVMMSITKRGSRFIAVGDPNQAIYGFAGADVDSFNKFKEMPNTKELPLSVCYRCSTNIVAMAKDIVPQIESREGAPEGRVNHDARIADITDGDIILCRNTYPLVKLGFQYIAQGVKAKIVGRDIGKNLINIIKKTKASTFDEMYDKFDVDLLKIEKDLIRLKGLTSKEARENSQCSNHEDKVNALKVIATGCDSISEMIPKIDGIFSDESTSGIMLSTIHKAKGLEADNVYIIHEELMPSKNAKTAWARAQERNLMYVAYTRAKNVLGFIVDFDAYKGGDLVLKKAAVQAQVSITVNQGDMINDEFTIVAITEMNTKFGSTKKYEMRRSDGLTVYKIGSMQYAKIISGGKIANGSVVKIKSPVKSVDTFNGQQQVSLGMLESVN